MSVDDNNTPEVDLSELIRNLHGRMAMKIEAVDHVTGQRKELILLDVDICDSIDISFVSDGIEEQYTFSFLEETYRKQLMNRQDRARRAELFAQKSEELAEELRSHELSADDYFEDHTVQLGDLPREEQLKVLMREAEDLFEEVEIFLSKQTPKPSLFSRLFSKS